MQAALDPRTPPSNICIRTLSVCLLFFLILKLFKEHTGRVFRLQFDEFQIVSSSHDDTILIWDFLNVLNTNNLIQNGALSSTPPISSQFMIGPSNEASVEHAVQ